HPTSGESGLSYVIVATVTATVFIFVLLLFLFVLILVILVVFALCPVVGFPDGVFMSGADHRCPSRLYLPRLFRLLLVRVECEDLLWTWYLCSGRCAKPTTSLRTLRYPT
ncbi:unnamed protein product, partial [Ectocarpus fasciculatus]